MKTHKMSWQQWEHAKWAEFEFDRYEWTPVKQAIPDLQGFQKMV